MPMLDETYLEKVMDTIANDFIDALVDGIPFAELFMAAHYSFNVQGKVICRVYNYPQDNEKYIIYIDPDASLIAVDGYIRQNSMMLTGEIPQGVSRNLLKLRKTIEEIQEKNAVAQQVQLDWEVTIQDFIKKAHQLIREMLEGRNVVGVWNKKFNDIKKIKNGIILKTNMLKIEIANKQIAGYFNDNRVYHETLTDDEAKLFRKIIRENVSSSRSKNKNSYNKFVKKRTQQKRQS